MIYKNKAILEGRVGADPEIKRFENGGVIASFSLATTESYKDKQSGEYKDVTEWHNIVAKWKSLAEFIENHVVKGCIVAIEGKISTRSWGDDGNKKYITEIVADKIDIDWQQKKSLSESDGSPVKQEVKVEQPDNESDDLPF